MAKIILPRYLRAKRLAKGGKAYFWERPSWAKPPAEKFGRECPVESEALGTDLSAAIGKADMLNAALDDWRTGVQGRPAEGTVSALFGWYRGHVRFLEASHRTREDYREMMAIVESVQLKTTVFGQRRAVEVNASHADALYRLLIKQKGERQGAYCMQVCRRVWNEAIRAKRVKDPNPFSRMGIKMTAKKGNRANTRAEYDLFRAKAREMGHQSMAAAAAISFELLRRVSDVFGYINEPGDEERGFFWEDYQPGVQFAMRQGKTGYTQIIPLRGDPDPDSDDPDVRARGALLYPELEAELARMERGQGHIVINERTGERFTEREVGRRLRSIREAAGLPKEFTMTGFRHGGATEMGDAGIYDIRPVSGHRTLQQTATYNKATQEKARSAGTARQRHIAERARKEVDR
ncbi:tyrosine-type recombinase/integrase [Sphingobium sp.]|uniref:tyrosine-type recombinase/integrase n=1 Tax=Sphingobium sp. TaxID=1912891 RepID=UPI003BB492C5